MAFRSQYPTLTRYSACARSRNSLFVWRRPRVLQLYDLHIFVSFPSSEEQMHFETPTQRLPTTRILVSIFIAFFVLFIKKWKPINNLFFCSPYLHRSTMLCADYWSNSKFTRERVLLQNSDKYVQVLLYLFSTLHNRVNLLFALLIPRFSYENFKGYDQTHFFFQI